MSQPLVLSVRFDGRPRDIVVTFAPGAVSDAMAARWIRERQHRARIEFSSTAPLDLDTWPSALAAVEDREQDDLVFVGYFAL